MDSIDNNERIFRLGQAEMEDLDLDLRIIELLRKITCRLGFIIYSPCVSLAALPK